MKRHTLGFALVAAVLAVVARGSGAEEAETARGSEPRFDLADHLPANTLVYVSVDDWSKSLNEWKRSDLGRLFDDPDVRESMESLGRQIVEGQTRGGASAQMLEISKGEDEFFKLLDGQLAVAVTSVSGEVPGVVLTLDAAKKSKALVTTLNLLIEQIASADPECVEGRVQTDAEGVCCVRIYGLELHYVWADSVLVVGTRKADLDRIVRSISGKSDSGDDRLSAKPAYRAMRAKLEPKRDGSFLFVDVESIVKMAGGRDAESEAGIAIAALGVRDIQAFGLTSAVADDGRGYVRARLAVPTGPSGIFDFITPGSASMATARVAPDDAIVCASIKVDGPRIWKNIGRMVGATDPKALVEVEKFLDTSAEGGPNSTQLVGAIGDELGYFVSLPRHGAVIPNMGLRLGLDDPRAFSGFLRHRLHLLGLKVDRIPARGKGFPIHIIRVDGPYQPAFAITKDSLLVGSTNAVLRGMLRRHASIADDSGRRAGPLADRKEFKETMSVVPDTASVVVYTDVPRIFEWLYGVAVPFLQSGLLSDLMATNEGGAQQAEAFRDIDWALLPEGGVISKHLRPSVGWISVDATGVDAQIHSSIWNGYTTLSMIAGATVGATLMQHARPVELSAAEMRRIKRAREEGMRKIDGSAERAEPSMSDHFCQLNLRKFHARYDAFKLKHGRPPTSIAEFAPVRKGRAPLFYYCLSDAGAKAARRRNDPTVNSYDFIGAIGRIPAKVDKPGRFVLLWDRRPTHGDKRVRKHQVLFLDGSIRSMTPTELVERKKETAALLLPAEK